MPKSKRNKVVHLTQVKKKGKDHKEDLTKQLEELVEKYEFVYMFDIDKTESNRIMNFRLKMKEHGRIFAGRNSLVKQTLKTIGSRTSRNYQNFLKYVTGHRALLFTDIVRDKMVSMLEEELEEFREKLLGYAQLKTPDDDTVGDGTNEEKMDEDNDDENADDDDDAKDVDGDGANLSCVSFRPIAKRKKKKTKKSKKNQPKETS